jgi:solute:Na+ symporter, SSS family
MIRPLTRVMTFAAVRLSPYPHIRSLMMKFHWIDLTIIALYLIANAYLGIFIRKKATKNMDSYFLGDRNVSWWMLGLSGCSSYIDVGGTMTLVGAMFYLGLKSIWMTHIFWGWLIICFYMAFQAKYIRRSGVMTFAEWNVTRFGNTRHAEYARLSAAIFLLVLMTFNLIFMAVGTGKFAAEFLPLARWQAGLVIFGIVGVYVTLGGMFGVILTDIFHTILIAIGIVILSVIVFSNPAGASFIAAKDPGWSSLMPTWTLWDGYLQNTPPAYQHYNNFGAILLGGGAWLIFRVLAGPNVWDFQFFLSTKSPREASLAAGMWTVGYTLRWLLACAFLVLGIYYLGAEAQFDAEKIMPHVLMRLPVGLQGMFMAVLLAALMSTLSSMINVTSSIITNDFLKRYYTAKLTQKQLVRFGQLASVCVIIIAFVFSLSFDNIVSAWEVMIFVVVTMILVPATMRWHWWRFSALAFVWSMVLSALVIVSQKIFFPGWQIGPTLAMDIFISFVLAVTLGFSCEPTETDVLVKFYSKVRPFGFWKPIRLAAEQQGLVPVNDPMPKIDMVNGGISVFFQASLSLIPFYLFLRRWNEVGLWIAIALALSVVLYFTWYKHLPSPDEI